MDQDPSISVLEASLLEWFREENSPPRTRSEIARALSIPPKDRASLRLAIQSLEDQGKLVRFKKGRYGPPSPQNSPAPRLTGTIEFPSPKTNRNAWIVLDPHTANQLPHGFSSDRVFVPARLTSTSLPGDQVAFDLLAAPQAKAKRHPSPRRRSPAPHAPFPWEARVTSVLQRQRSHFTARLKLTRGFAHAIPDEAAFPRPFELDPNDLPPDAQDNSLVVLELLDWNSPFQPPHGHVIKVLGPAGSPGVDVLRIIHQYDLPLDFPPQVLAEASAVPREVSPEEITPREDWRQRPVYTIDPATARDFDDAICVTPLHDGGYELGVFIADVAHYVPSGSAMDREARRRGNSVYLVDRVIPMLPEALSNGICSLHPLVDRLTLAAILTFDAEGARTGVRFAKAVIRSQRRFTYEEAAALLKTPGPTADSADPTDIRFRAHLQEAWSLASRLRLRRMAQGSLDLDFPEVEVLLDALGATTGLRLVAYDESHQLIEEFMLAANEAVAEYTKIRQAGSIYRIHENPDPAKLFEFRDLALTFGLPAGDLTLRPELQKLIASIKASFAERALSLALLKSLKRACYSADPLGHFGLAKSNYTHFTSPIRRYADLVVHRVLEKLTTHPASPARLPRRTELEEIATHISGTERLAADAERDSKMLKQFEFLLQLSQKAERTRFPAIVLEVSPRGIFIEIQNYYLRGLIRKTDLPRGQYHLDPKAQRVLGPQGGLLYSPGSTLTVELIRVDAGNHFLDFLPAPP